MKRRPSLVSLLIAGALLAGCGGKDTPKTPTPPKQLPTSQIKVTVSGGKVSLSKKTLPANTQVRVDYAVDSKQPVSITLINNGVAVNTAEIKRGDQKYVLVAKVLAGKFIAKVGKSKATAAVTG